MVEVTTSERLLVFGIIGLFAAAALVRVGTRADSASDAPPSPIQVAALYRFTEPADTMEPALAESTVLGIAANRRARKRDRLKAITLCAKLRTDAALPVLRQIADSARDTELRTAAELAMTSIGAEQ